MIQMLRLKIVHHFLHLQQKLMICLLTKQIIFTLQCLCTIWLNIAKHFAKQLSEGFKRSVYLNSYETRPAKVIEQGKNLYELLYVSFPGVRRLFVLAYANVVGAENDEAGIKDNKKYFLPRGEIKNYNVLIDGRNFYDQ